MTTFLECASLLAAAKWPNTRPRPNGGGHRSLYGRGRAKQASPREGGSKLPHSKVLCVAAACCGEMTCSTKARGFPSIGSVSGIFTSFSRLGGLVQQRAQ